MVGIVSHGGWLPGPGGPCLFKVKRNPWDIWLCHEDHITSYCVDVFVCACLGVWGWCCFFFLSAAGSGILWFPSWPIIPVWGLLFLVGGPMLDREVYPELTVGPAGLFLGSVMGGHQDRGGLHAWSQLGFLGRWARQCIFLLAGDRELQWWTLYGEWHVFWDLII